MLVLCCCVQVAKEFCMLLFPYSECLDWTVERTFLYHYIQILPLSACQSVSLCHKWAPRPRLPAHTHIHTPIQADQPSGRSVSPEVVEGGWLTGWLVICMALEFKRSYRCRNPHTAERTLLLTQMLRLGLLLLFKYMWISGSSDIFFCWVRRSECAPLHRYEECTVAWWVLSLEVETKGAGHTQRPSIWRPSHQLATEPNMLLVMSLVILVQFLLLGLGVIGTTSDTWRHCTGIVLFYLIFTSLSFHSNMSDDWFNG